MISLLLSHQWKAFIRSRNAAGSVVVTVFMVIAAIYMLAVAVFVGISLKHYLLSFFPGQDIVKIYCSYIIYYFLAEIMGRFLLQNLPSLVIQPYLLQNIRRGALIQFLNVRSLFTVINIFTVVLFFPFAIMVMGPRFGTLPTASFILSILSLALFNHFIILYIKRKSIFNSWWYLIFFGIIGFFAAADYFHLFSLYHISGIVFNFLLMHPLLCLTTIAMAVFAYANNYRFLLNNLNLDDLGAKKKKKESADYALLNRFGIIGELAGLEIKLVLRNKKPRSSALVTGLFLFYGFFFYKQKYIDHNWWGMLLFFATIITSVFVSNYGQFLFSWQSGHFDGIMARNISVKTYIKSKFVMLTAGSTIVMLLTSAYAVWSWKLLLVQLAAYLFNAGISPIIMIYIATRSYKAVDITKKAAFKAERMDLSKLLFFMVLLVPMILYGIFALLFNPYAGLLAVGLAGMICFLLQDWWIDVMTREFLKRKYKILEGFREK